MAEAPARVFLSYSSADIGVVNGLYDVMSQHQLPDGSKALEIFQDEKKIDIGEDWKARVRVELRNADCVMLVWSEHSAKSRWALQEATYAAIEDKLTGVLLKKNVSPPELLSNANAVRYFEWSDAERAARIARVCDQLLERTRAWRGVVVDLDPETEVTRVNREPQDPMVMQPCLQALHDERPGCIFLLPAHDLEYPNEFALRYAHYVLPGALRQMSNGKELLKQYTPGVIEVFPSGDERKAQVADLLANLDQRISEKLDQSGSSLADSFRHATTLFPVLHAVLPASNWRLGDGAELASFIERLASLPAAAEPRRFFTVFVTLWYATDPPPELPAKRQGLLRFIPGSIALEARMRDLGEETSAHFVEPLEKIQWSDVSTWRDDYQDQLPSDRFTRFKRKVRRPFRDTGDKARKHYADVVDELADALQDAIAWHRGG